MGNIKLFKNGLNNGFNMSVGKPGHSCGWYYLNIVSDQVHRFTAVVQ